MENKTDSQTDNEFEKMYNETNFGEVSDSTQHDNVKHDNVKHDNNDLVADTNTNQEFDFSRASDKTKTPERIDLDDKTVTIIDAKIILPSPDKPWDLSKDKQTEYKPCQFVLFYDIDNQREYYSGIKVFKKNVNGEIKYSEPAILDNARNQASQLKLKYAEFKGVKSEDVSLKEFLSYLLTKPKAVIKVQDIEFEGKITKKNLIGKFI